MQRVHNIHQRAERAHHFLEKPLWSKETGSLLRSCFAAVENDLTAASEVVIQQKRMLRALQQGSGVFFTLNAQERSVFVLSFGAVQGRPQSSAVQGSELRREFAFRNESDSALFLKPSLIASSSTGAPIQWNKKVLQVDRDTSEKLVFALTPDLEEGRHAFLVQLECSSREGGDPLCEPVKILLTTEVDTLRAVVSPIDFSLSSESGATTLSLGSFYEATGIARRRFRLQNVCGIPMHVHVHIQPEEHSCRLEVVPSMKSVKLEPASEASRSAGKDVREFEIRLFTDSEKVTQIRGTLQVFLQGNEGSKLEIQDVPIEGKLLKRRLALLPA
eukprot:4897320-Prymnesium_polylepis.1